MKLKLIKSCSKALPILSICLLISGISTLHAQYDNSNSVMQSTDKAVEQINKVGDEEKAKYAENIDKPYIPSKVSPEHTIEEAKTMLASDLKKYVNYYSASKVPAYKILARTLR